MMEGGHEDEDRGDTRRYIPNHAPESEEYIIVRGEIPDILETVEARIAAWYMRCQIMPVPPFTSGWLRWPWWATWAYKVLTQELGKWRQRT